MLCDASKFGHLGGLLFGRLPSFEGTKLNFSKEQGLSLCFSPGLIALKLKPLGHLRRLALRPLELPGMCLLCPTCFVTNLVELSLVLLSRPTKLFAAGSKGRLLLALDSSGLEKSSRLLIRALLRGLACFVELPREFLSFDLCLALQLIQLDSLFACRQLCFFLAASRIGQESSLLVGFGAGGVARALEVVGTTPCIPS